MTEQEQNPHIKTNDARPAMVEDSSDDSSSADEPKKMTTTRKTDGRSDPNDDDSIRSESPPSKLREGMDFLNQIRYRCGNIVNNENTQFFVVILIAINAIMMGIGTFDFVNENPIVNKAFDDIDELFLIIFTVELGMQFIFHGWRLLMDGWLVFDLTVIVISWAFSTVQIVRAFRIFRALRLITRVQVMKNLVLGKFKGKMTLNNRVFVKEEVRF